MMNNPGRIMAIVALMLAIPAGAYASGFANPDLSASAAGVANAFVATANDPSAMAFNPAGIAWSNGVAVMGGGSLIRARNTSLKTPGVVYPDLGGKRSTYHFYATVMPHTSNFGFGIGYVSAFDADNNWGAIGPGYGVTDINIQRTSLDAIYAISSNLAVAVGGDWYHGKMTLSNDLVKFNGKSDLQCFGEHVSLMWRPWYGWSFGMMARTGPKIKFKGDGGTSTMMLPDEVMAGVAHDFTDHIRFELDADWMHWKDVGGIGVAGGTAAQHLSLNTHDSLTAMAGLTWTWRENATFRFGYAFDGAASKTSSFNPVIPNQNGHRLSFGGGFDAFGLHTDVSYSYTFYPISTVSGALSGTYRSRSQSMLVSISKVF